MTVQERIENNKDAKPASNGFSRTLPEEFNGDAILMEGDIIHIPSKYVFEGDNANVFEQVFGGKVSQFVVCEITKANGEKSAINFFPTQMVKSIFVYEKNNAGEAVLKLPVLNPKGSAPEKMLSFRGKKAEGKTDMDLAMNALAGENIKVTGDLKVQTVKWNNGVRTNELKDAHVYTYDIV